MRKSHALLIVVALLAELPCAVGLRAQGTRSATVGVIGGVATTSFVGKDAADDLERRIGVLAGLSAVFATASRVQVEIDGLYATKGFRSPGPSGYFDFSASYLEVPVLLRLSFAPDSRLRPFIAAGPAFGLRLDCGATIVSSAGTSNVTCGDLEKAMATKVTKTDVSGVLGAGLEFPFGAVQSTLAVRYSRGFSSVLGGDNHFRALSFYVGLSKARRK